MATVVNMILSGMAVAISLTAACFSDQYLLYLSVACWASATFLANWQLRSLGE